MENRRDYRPADSLKVAQKLTDEVVKRYNELKHAKRLTYSEIKELRKIREVVHSLSLIHI